MRLIQLGFISLGLLLTQNASALILGAVPATDVVAASSVTGGCEGLGAAYIRFIKRDTDPTSSTRGQVLHYCGKCTGASDRALVGDDNALYCMNGSTLLGLPVTTSGGGTVSYQGGNAFDATDAPLDSASLYGPSNSQ